MKLTNYGKLCIANIEFEKGVAFVAAAILLDREAKSEPQEYVVLHLLSQGIELLAKGVLYARDYDNYKKNGRKIGHQLEFAYAVVKEEFGLNPLHPSVEQQLKSLSKLYSAHALRYASSQDMFVMPSSIDISLIKAKVKYAIKLGRREFRRAFSGYASS